jgi:hypothetical protein
MGFTDFYKLRTVNICPYGIICFVFVMEIECAKYTVRNEALSALQVDFWSI